MSNFDANAIFFIKKTFATECVVIYFIFHLCVCSYLNTLFVASQLLDCLCYLLGRSQSIRVWRLELWVKHRDIIERINCSPNEKFAVDSILWTTATWIIVRSMVDLLNKRNQNCRTGTRIFGWWHLSCSTIFIFDFSRFLCQMPFFFCFFYFAREFDFCEMHSISIWIGARLVCFDLSLLVFSLSFS